MKKVTRLSRKIRKIDTKLIKLEKKRKWLDLLYKAYVQKEYL